MCLACFCGESDGCVCVVWLFFFQAEDGIRDLVRSRGLGDVYKRQDIDEGRAIVEGRNADGSVIAFYSESKAKPPSTQWLSLIHI